MGETPVSAAFAADGAATVVWQHEVGSGHAVIEAASRPSLGSFGVPAILSAAEEDSLYPQVAESAEGVATAVWMNVTVGAIEATTIHDGVAAPPVRLSAAGFKAEYPSVAVDAGGAAIVAWTSEHEGAQRVEASYRPAGGGFGAPQVLGSDVGPLPKVAIDGAGEATVVWPKASGPVEVATASAGGAFSAAVQLPSESGTTTDPNVAANAAGERAIAWTESNGSNEVVKLVTGETGDAFSAPATLSSGIFDTLLPQVALDASGALTVAWTELTTEPSVTVIEATPSGADSAPRRIGDDAALPSIAENEAGAALIAWPSQSAPDAAEAAYRPAGAGFEAARIVSPAGSAIFSSVAPGYSPVAAAVDGEGDGLAAFDLEGEGGEPSVALLDAAGPALDGLSIPATGTAGTPVGFSVAPADQISAVASTTWSFGDATSASGDTVTHTFANPGTYSVSVTSTDADGNSTTKTGEITISPVLAQIPPAKIAPAEALPKFTGARIVTRSARANRKGGFRLRVRCVADTDCTGVARLTLKLKIDKLPAAAINLGKDKFRAASGARVYVTFKLKKSLLALLRKQGRLELTAAVQASDYRGQSATTKAKVTLKKPAKAAKAKKKKRRKRH